MGIDHVNAFPANNEMLVCGTGGMDLRDWFAGMALQGELSGILPGFTLLNLNAREISESAYNIADAMMEQRNRPATSGKE